MTIDECFQRVLSGLKVGDVVLPAAPVVLTKMRAAMQSQTVDATQMASLVAQDQRLASEVLRLANTAHYARAGRISDLQAAVTRIGFKQIHQIVETVLLRSAFSVRNPWTLNCLTEIWRRGVASALACRALATALPATARIDPGVAYLAGLFCDVGASFLLSILDEEQVPFDETFDEAALAVALAAHHQGAGKRLMEAWDMDAFVQLAACAHHPESKQLTGPGMCRAIVGVGSMVADLLSLPPDLTWTRPLLEHERKALLSVLRLPAAQLEKVAEAIKADFDAITNAN